MGSCPQLIEMVKKKQDLEGSWRLTVLKVFVGI
jgi:hypothetical protein